MMFDDDLHRTVSQSVSQSYGSFVSIWLHPTATTIAAAATTTATTTTTTTIATTATATKTTHPLDCEISAHLFLAGSVMEGSDNAPVRTTDRSTTGLDLTWSLT